MAGSHTAGGSRAERFGKHVLAGLLLLVVAVIVIKLAIGMLLALFVPLLAIVAVIALVWAIRVLL